mmetsp:Transcript_6905/g.12403  ORF Transcript_6905/g.12403 Transcript_6905/m.12403 type:complete len:168 (+) Transcript_6905:1888-2391(+)
MSRIFRTVISNLMTETILSLKMCFHQATGFACRLRDSRTIIVRRQSQLERLAAYMDVTAQLFHGVPIVYSTAAIGYVRTRVVPNVLRAQLGFVSRMVAGGGALFLVVIRGQGTNSFVRRTAEASVALRMVVPNLRLEDPAYVPAMGAVVDVLLTAAKNQLNPQQNFV